MIHRAQWGVSAVTASVCHILCSWTRHFIQLEFVNQVKIFRTNKYHLEPWSHPGRRVPSEASRVTWNLPPTETRSCVSCADCSKTYSCDQLEQIRLFHIFHIQCFYSGRCWALMCRFVTGADKKPKICHIKDANLTANITRGSVLQWTARWASALIQVFKGCWFESLQSLWTL